MTCLFMFNGSLRLFIVQYLPSPSSLPPFSNTKMFWFCSEFSLEKSEFRHVNTSSFPSDILQSDAVTYITVRYAFACSGVGRGCDRLPPPSGNAHREAMPSTGRALRPTWRGGPHREPCLRLTARPGPAPPASLSAMLLPLRAGSHPGVTSPLRPCCRAAVCPPSHRGEMKQSVLNPSQRKPCECRLSLCFLYLNWPEDCLNISHGRFTMQIISCL